MTRLPRRALTPEQNTVDLKVAQQIEAVLMKDGEAYTRGDAAAITTLDLKDTVELLRRASEGVL